MRASSTNSGPNPGDPVFRGLGEALSGVPKSKKLLVGVSGGRDSMVLLDALLKSGFTNLVVCHVNHMLRGRSAMADERLVRRVAGKLGLPIEMKRVQTASHAEKSSISIELAARELRYAFFEECARRNRCRVLLLAHHADDQVETCLFNFLRGSGVAGLGGMKPLAKRGALSIRRPLLGVRRSEIDDYRKSHKVPYREDASNAETRHTRNRLRHEVMPALEAAVGPSFRKAILRAASILRVEDEWMSSLIPPPEKTLSVKMLRAMHPAAQSRHVLSWLRAQGVADAGASETQRVLSMLSTGGPAKVNLPQNLHARRRAGVVFLEKGSK